VRLERLQRLDALPHFGQLALADGPGRTAGATVVGRERARTSSSEKPSDCERLMKRSRASAPCG
jgi:hypothetical protein